MITPPPYKEYQYLYRDLVQDHDDAIDKVPSIVTANTLEEKLRGAMAYFEAQSFPIIYPGKSYGVAVVYAQHILRDYGIPVLETLNDSDLFLGEDPYFVVYQDDPETYDRLLEKLQPLGDVTELGWAKQTSEYYRLECTDDGLAEVMTRG